MSTGFVDAHHGNARQFHRKPVPSSGANTRIQPLTAINNSQPQQQPRTTSLQQPPSQPHSRSPSSGAIGVATSSYPQNYESQQSHHSSYQAYMSQQAPGTRRTLSNGTSSTASTGHGTGQPMRKNSTASTLQRSVSSRSGSNPTSYVALMRKQKATVWSDRAQFEDPRVVAQQRAAKMRANMEVAGANVGPGGRLSTSGQYSLTGGVRAKIRHHGAPKAQQYTPGIHPASGVPMRLSAREVDEDDSDDDNAANRAIHHRSGSGRSSTGSGGRMHSFQGNQRTPSGLSNGGSTSPRARVGQDNRISPRNTTEPTPATGSAKGNEYFTQQDTTGRPSAHSSDNSEREDSFGKASGLPVRVKSPAQEEREKADLAELHRRGSVDERTMTMRGLGKLFVANPDVDD